MSNPFAKFTQADVDARNAKVARNYCPACDKLGVIVDNKETHRCGTKVLAREPLRRIVITGQIRGGKNNINITRSGRRFPNPAWATWRDDAVMQVKAQIPFGFQTLTEPVNIRLDYYAGDRRRRDCPAVLDAVWHVLEKAGVVKDDMLLWPSQSSRSYDKLNPRCVIEFPMP
jgi:Holliday junction resolvase RusA-like endonuclease